MVLARSAAPAEVEAELARLGEIRRGATGAGQVFDPHARLAALRAEAPVHEGSVSELLGLAGPAVAPHLTGPRFACLDWATCDTVLRDAQTFSSASYEGLLEELIGRNILMMDGAEHRRYRALVQPALTRNVMDRWVQRWIGPLVDGLLAGIERDGVADLDAALFSKLPVHTITAALGVPRQDALMFHTWSLTMLLPAVGRDEQQRASEAIADYLLPLVAHRRAHPTDDVLSLLAQAEYTEDGERYRLDDEEIIAFARLLLPGGAGTTWRQLAIIVFALLHHPEQLAALRADRTLVRDVIEESLRWDVNITIFGRLTTRAVTVGGVDIPAGAVVESCLTAANRDPSRWADPDRFDITRPLLPHLAFGQGPHLCVGIHLARTEMTVALDAILDRLPGLRFDPSVPPPELTGLLLRVPTHLRVLWDPPPDDVGF